MQKPPSWNQIRTEAARFAARWADETDENASSQSFWNEFLQIFGIDRKRVATFEARAQRSSTGGRGRIDLFWPGVLVAEQKSAGRDLAAAEEQAIDYLESIGDDGFPGHVITSDFARIRIRDLGGDNVPYEFPLTDLAKEIDRFGFIAGYTSRTLSPEKEHEVDVAAAQLMGSLYEQLAATGMDDHEISVFLIRILFLMFGDDTGLWEKGLFLEYLETRTQPDGSDLGPQIIYLFQTLDRPIQKRSQTLDELLQRFPYVNGGLFADRLLIPALTAEMRTTLIECSHIDWGSIVPAIFGSLFQTIKSREDRRFLGEHYTSEENILKVIRPLFLDQLNTELDAAFNDTRGLKKLRQKLGGMTFLDPACGSGNFLVIAYRELRNLELRIMIRLRELTGEEQLLLDSTLGLQVSPAQFFGIEFEEWPAKIAETAMFLVDHQCNLELAQAFGEAPDRLPIATTATIVHANALEVPWDQVFPMTADTKIMGNPPFLGSLMLSEGQKADAVRVWGTNKRLGTMDYVTNWFVIAGRLCQEYGLEAAFVSTNSITQGEQVGVLWDELGKSRVRINFAHQTFSWSNEAAGQAAVHVVIVGLTAHDSEEARLYTYTDIKGTPKEMKVPSINPYLIPGPITVIRTRTTPLNDGQVQMRFGSMPRDGGWLSKIDPVEAERIRKSDPVAAKYLRRLIGADELINSGERYCLWLVDADPADLRSSPVLKERMAQVRAMREASKAASTRKMAATPGLFGQIGQPATTYLAVPRVSSENRRYVPMALFGPDVIASDALLTISDADLFAFGLLQSSAFNAWNRTVSGRLKSDTRISAEITYHNFPYPAVTPEAQIAIEEAAQKVLDERAKHPNSTLADLYDPLSMPKGLLEAHQNLDKATLKVYGLTGDVTETQILEALFARYRELTSANQLEIPTPTNVKRQKPAKAPSKSAVVRVWAAENGITVPARGRIPKDITAAWERTQTSS